MKLATAFCLACSVQLALSQGIINNYFNIPRFEFGFCPSFKTVPDFDRERYYGAWYSQLQVPSTFQPEDMTCVRAFYRPRKDDTVSVYNTGTDPNGVVLEICGKAWQNDKENPGSWLVRQVLNTFTNHLCDITTHNFKFSFPTSPVDGDYEILDVDYDSYAVVYSCSQFLFFKYELGWILTRKPQVSQDLVGCKVIYRI